MANEARANQYSQRTTRRQECSGAPTKQTPNSLEYFSNLSVDVQPLRGSGCISQEIIPTVVTGRALRRKLDSLINVGGQFPQPLLPRIYIGQGRKRFKDRWSSLSKSVPTSVWVTAPIQPHTGCSSLSSSMYENSCQNRRFASDRRDSNQTRVNALKFNKIISKGPM